MRNKARSADEKTETLRDWRGNRHADSTDALLKLVYAELHRQAHRYLQKERRGHTLQTTALVHEAYLKISRTKIGRVGKPFSLFRHRRDDDAADFD